MSELLDEKPLIEKKYLNGSLSKLITCDTIYTALFWKNKESAEYRIESLSRNEKVRNEFLFNIKQITRMDFIRCIPVAPKSKNRFEFAYWEKNIKTREKEIGYMRKLNKAKLDESKSV